MLRQLDLFATGRPAFDAAFRSLRRTVLSHGAWVDHVPGWVSGHDALFDELERGLDWRRETMTMYDKTLVVPRLLARVDRDGAGQPLLESMRLALSQRYAEELVFTTAALYRDGSDSVAFHGDTTARDMLEALVATVSLGAPRRFLLKPAQGGSSIAFSLGRGDLVVMGGSCQRTWRHGIPKVASAGPRIALMFRPAWARNYRTSVANDASGSSGGLASVDRDRTGTVEQPLEPGDLSQRRLRDRRDLGGGVGEHEDRIDQRVVMIRHEDASMDVGAGGSPTRSMRRK